MRLVIASGKGGVGKSVVSVLLASAAAADGQRVLLVDADQNLGNLHVLLGARPVATQASVLDGAVPVGAAVQPVAEGIWLLAGDSGHEALYALSERDRSRLHLRLAEAGRDFDLTIVDAAPGLEGAVRVAALGADRTVLLCTPEPTALTDAYALLKTLTLKVPAVPVDVLVNRALDADEGRVAFEKLALGAERFLRRGVRYLGALPEDAAVRRAVRDPRRLLADLAASEAARVLRYEVLTRMDLPPVARSVA